MMKTVLVLGPLVFAAIPILLLVGLVVGAWVLHPVAGVFMTLLTAGVVYDGVRKGVFSG